MAAKGLTHLDNGKTVLVRTGDELLLRLDENPTTGYRWVLEGDVHPVLEVLDVQYVQPPATGLGRGGQRVWTLRAKSSGSVGLLLELRRAWEGDKSIVKRFEVTVQVAS
jgi:inhibitor of cysteine peptidase